MEVYYRAGPPPPAAVRLYRTCVAIKEKGERMGFDPLIAIGKAATALVSRFVVVGGGKK